MVPLFTAAERFYSSSPMTQWQKTKQSKLFQIDHKAAHLEPHGVPSSGLLTHMPRALSDVKLEETPLQAQEEGYGANLTIPGGEDQTCR